MNWQEFRGQIPGVLHNLGSDAQLHDGAWWMRQGGVAYRAPIGGSAPVGVGRVARPNLNDMSMTQVALGVGGGTGMGALTDDALQTAAGALLTYLQTSGCTPSVNSTVLAFQQAYIAAGQTLPNDSNGTTGADGLYGNNTQIALQNVLNAGPNQPPQQAPAGCVPAGTGGGAGTIVVVPPGSSSSDTLTEIEPWAIGAAVILGAGLVGMAVLHKDTRNKVKGHANRLKAHVSRARETSARFTRRHA